MNAPDPELIDDENPEWKNEDFAKAVPFSELPTELQDLLDSPRHVSSDQEKAEPRQPAA